MKLKNTNYISNGNYCIKLVPINDNRHATSEKRIFKDAFYRYNLPKLIQLGFDAAADKTFTLWLVSNSPFIKYRALSLDYTDYANQLDQQAPFSTNFQTISFPTMSSCWFAARLASRTVHWKGWKSNFSKIPTRDLKSITSKPCPLLQKVKLQSSMNYNISKLKNNKTSISQLKFGDLSNNDFTFFRMSTQHIELNL